MPSLYFENEKTGKRYDVVRIIKDDDGKPNEVVLRGDLAEFTEPFDKERFTKMGYTLKKG